MNGSTEPTDDPQDMGKAKDAAAKDTVVAAAAHAATAHATNADAEALAHWGEGGAQDDPTRDWLVLTAASADMDTIATADGVYRYASPASRRLFGWDPTGLSFSWWSTTRSDARHDWQAQAFSSNRSLAGRRGPARMAPEATGNKASAGGKVVR